MISKLVQQVKLHNFVQFSTTCVFKLKSFDISNPANLTFVNKFQFAQSSETVTNALGRTFPKFIDGYGELKPYKGKRQPPTPDEMPSAVMTYRMINHGENKVLNSLEEALKLCGIKDGMTVSFHHHLRNGDIIANELIGLLQKLKIKNINLAPSSVHPNMIKVEEGLKDGTIRTVQTGTNGKVGVWLSEGNNKEPIIIRSHGGRVRAVRAKKIEIDIAIVVASEADEQGNCNGIFGRNACGPLAYSHIDAQFAKKVVLVTDNLQPYPITRISIPEYYIDHVVKVASIGDPSKIASTTTKIPNSEPALSISRNIARTVEALGILKNGFNFQAGAGGSSLLSVKFVGDICRQKKIQAGMLNGGTTQLCVDLLREGIIRKIFTGQAFDQAAIKSMGIDYERHVEINVDHYANPFNKGQVVNQLDFAVLGGTQVDVNFNVNVNSRNDGYMMHNTGGHQDVAEGTKLCVIAIPTHRGNNPTIVDKVITITTPGNCIDVISTQYGIAINPNRKDLIKKIQEFKANNPTYELPVKTIQELKEIGEKAAGRKFELPKVGEKVVGIVEWRDGTVIDVIREVINKKSKYGSVKSDIAGIAIKKIEGEANVVKIEALEQAITPIKEQEELVHEILNFYGIKGVELSYGDFSAQKWVVAARIEAAIKEQLQNDIPEEQRNKPYLLPLEFLKEEDMNVKGDAQRLRRSNHYIPGNDANMVQKCGGLKTDVAIIDLEDAVHPAKKDLARIIARNALRNADWKKTERAIRINQGEMGLKDLEAIIPYSFVELVVIPKVETADEIRAISAKLNELREQKGQKKPIFVLPLIESAKGVENAFQIAAVSKEPGIYMIGMSMGLEDYSSDLGIFDRSDDDKESKWAQSRIINASLAHHLQVFDSVYSDFKNMDGMQKAVLRGKEIGYTGKRTIHPDQIAVCNALFLPNEKEIRKAKDIVIAMYKSKDGGVAALKSGKMIDKPVMDRATKLLKTAIEQKIVPTNWLEAELAAEAKKK